jgi:hypothetical protein
MTDPSTKPSTKLVSSRNLSKTAELHIADAAMLKASFPNLSDAQREAVAAHAAQAARRCAGPDMSLELTDSTLRINYAHEYPEIAAALIMADVGTCDPAFYEGISGQLARIGSVGKTVDETTSNFILSVVRSVKPRDELEAMLAVQMGAIHDATMTFARRLNQAKTLAQQDAAERALNKLARTFAAQLDGFKRYRTGGQQKVVVEHVTVNEGGQAIVGNVGTRGGVNDQ